MTARRTGFRGSIRNSSLNVQSLNLDIHMEILIEKAEDYGSLAFSREV